VITCHSETVLSGRKNAVENYQLPLISRTRAASSKISSASFILSGKLHPALNMAIDEALLRCAQERGAQGLIVRFYDWDRPSVSIGYFLNHSMARAMVAPDAENPFVVRRPTGGGMVRHGSDVTYSMIFPQAWLPPEFSGDSGSYRFVHGILSKALLGIREFEDIEALPGAGGQRGKIFNCFAQPSPFDLMLHGKKIAGAAQRRSKGWILHQGSVQWEHAIGGSVAGRSVILSRKAEKDLPRRFFACLTQAQNDIGPNIFRPLTPEESQLASQLFATRYNTPAWNKKF